MHKDSIPLGTRYELPRTRTANRMKRKYKNIPVEIDGHKFPSKKEGARYAVLKLRLHLGEISGLILQPKFTFMGSHGLITYKSGRVVTYIADFSYWENGEPLEHVVEDAKGFQTPAFKLKWALMKACNGIEVKIT